MAEFFIYLFFFLLGATAVDALAAGYRVILIDDCCRGVDMRDIEKTKNTVMMNNGVIVDSSKVIKFLENLGSKIESNFGPKFLGRKLTWRIINFFLNSISKS